MKIVGKARRRYTLRTYGVALGRRLRSLKLWFVLRYFGAEKLAALLREHVRLAQEFASWVEADPGSSLLAPVNFSVVVFRARGEKSDALNARILAAVHETGEVFMSHTIVSGAYALRIAIGNIRTADADVKRAWELVAAAASAARAELAVSPDVELSP